MPNFPPTVYYRDTYGFDDRPSESDNDSITTKSTVTVRTTYNINPGGGGGMAINPTYQQIHNRNMNNGDSSKAMNYSHVSNSFHVEQLVTSKILTPNPRTILICVLIAAASAVQLIASLIAAALSFIECTSFFFWTALLIGDEEKYLEKVGANDNRIVTSTRIAMYMCQMLFGPIHLIACGLIIWKLRTQLSPSDEVVNGYFLSEPELGHQKILVPIELRQIRDQSDDETENASIGVQTGGSRNN
ncbi:hypothetical protein CAEBREN_05616 [Caenorhabditis brenneri]|uniref:Uncharacterized protein n=1 Tax=Caenorhabditis brenneri TaxID=135651 RepID=G0NWU8_CAEBE|nr:hypothetical protein CAEBREN_05616 [Caenorhabditis brenneri]